MTIDDTIGAALASERTIDITTTGRKTGKERRIEIWFHNLDGRIFITGMPGTRSWYANLLASPDFTLHIKQSFQRDVPAKATPVIDEAQRRAVFNAMMESLPRLQNLRANFDQWLEDSPLVEVEIPA